jgi:hypothetical protein
MKQKHYIYIILSIISVAISCVILTNNSFTVETELKTEISKNKELSQSWCDQATIQKTLLERGAQDVRTEEISPDIYFSTFIMGERKEYQVVERCVVKKDVLPVGVRKLSTPLYLEHSKVLALGLYEDVPNRKLGIAFYQVDRGYIIGIKYTETALLQNETVLNKVDEESKPSALSVRADLRGLLIDVYDITKNYNSSFSKEGDAVTRTLVVQHSQFSIQNQYPEVGSVFQKGRILLGDSANYFNLRESQKQLLTRVLYGTQPVSEAEMGNCVLKYYSDVYLLGGCKKTGDFSMYVYSIGKEGEDYSGREIIYSPDRGVYLENSDFIISYTQNGIAIFNRTNEEFRLVPVMPQPNTSPRLRFNIAPDEFYIDWYSNIGNKGEEPVSTELFLLK